MSSPTARWGSSIARRQVAAAVVLVASMAIVVGVLMTGGTTGPSASPSTANGTTGGTAATPGRRHRLACRFRRHVATRCGVGPARDRPARHRRRPARRSRRCRRRPARHRLHAHEPIGRRRPCPGRPARDRATGRPHDRRRGRNRVGRAATIRPARRGSDLPVHAPSRGRHGRGLVGLPGACAAARGLRAAR